jgi:hypothetical protein
MLLLHPFSEGYQVARNGVLAAFIGYEFTSSVACDCFRTINTAEMHLSHN